MLYPPTEDLPGSGIEPTSLMSPPLEAGSLPPVPPGNPSNKVKKGQIIQKYFPTVSLIKQLFKKVNLYVCLQLIQK